MFNSFFMLLALCTILSCKPPEARKPIAARTATFFDTSVKRNKAQYTKEKEEFVKFMASHSQSMFTASPEGFWYSYDKKISSDSLATPAFGDSVTFRYNVKSLDGTFLYTMKDLGVQHYVMDKQELIAGLREGLKHMKSGETVTFLFPSQKAYGYYGDQHKIGSNMPLICQVTVDTIMKQNQTRSSHDMPF